MFHTPKIWPQKFTHLIQCHKPTTSTNILQTLSRAWVNDNINFCQRAWILIKNWGCCKQLKKNCIRHSAMFAIQPWSTLLPTEAPSPATIQTLTIHPSSPPRTTLQLSPLQSPAVLPVPTPRTPASPSTPPPPTLQPVVPFGSPPSPFVWPPPPFGSPGPFQSLPSPTLRPPRLFPFDLDDVRAYRYTLTQIPNRFNSVFPPDFPYGVPEVTILSPYKLMRPLLFARQITRFADVSRILEQATDKLFFLGTWIKGVPIPENPLLHHWDCCCGKVFFRIPPGIFDIRNPNCTGMTTDWTHVWSFRHCSSANLVQNFSRQGI